ncbi:MAG: porin [Bacteroidales bacterium]|nr:porin [Bacteroidales bacterium]
MSRFVFTLAFILICWLPIHAQTELDERAVISFEKGLGFHAPDSAFGLNLRFRIQNRMGLKNTLGNDVLIDEVEARIRRLRLRIDGYTKNQRLTYFLQLSFSRDDQDWDNSKIPNVVRDAMVYYRFNPKFYIGFGQGKLPGNRQRINSSGQLQFADRSIVNAEFNIDRDFGLMLYFSDNLGVIDYNLKGAISSGEGRNNLKSDNGLAYTGRIELLPLGKFLFDGDFSEGDLVREIRPKLALSVGYSFNHKALKEAGQRGVFLYEPRDIHTFYGDLLFKYMGWAWSSELMQRNVDNPLTYAGEDSIHIVTGKGFTTQLSHYLINTWEVAGRFSMIEPDHKVSALEAAQTEYTLGVTKYIRKHRVKAQGNVTYGIFRPLTGPENAYLNVQFQVELGI